MCQFKLDVPQFLIQMQTILRSAIPPGLQPTLTKTMAEYKDTVATIYKIKQRAPKLQTDANTAKRPLASPTPAARTYATGVGAAGTGSQPTTVHSPNMGLVKPSTAGAGAATASHQAPSVQTGSFPALPGNGVDTPLGGPALGTTAGPFNHVVDGGQASRSTGLFALLPHIYC